MVTVLRENPTFTCGFFPIILDEIFKKAYENRKDTKWAKSWIKFGNLISFQPSDIIEFYKQIIIQSTICNFI